MLRVQKKTGDNLGFCRETEKLLFAVFTKLFSWDTQLLFKQGVSKSKRIIEYPIKTVDVT